jgi:hypothetical protein
MEKNMEEITQEKKNETTQLQERKKNEKMEK